MSADRRQVVPPVDSEPGEQAHQQHDAKLVVNQVTAEHVAPRRPGESGETALEDDGGDL
jgi:hypothetical protein